MIEAQLQRIEQVVPDLMSGVEVLDKKVDALKQERQKLLEKQLGTKKSITTLRHLETDMDELETENSRLHKERAALREYLSSILAKTKALGSAYEA